MIEQPYIKNMKTFANILLFLFIVMIIAIVAQSCQNENKIMVNRRGTDLVMERNVKYLEEVSAKIVNIFDEPNSKTYTVTLEYEGKMNNKTYTYEELGHPCNVKVDDYLVVGLYAVYDDVTGEEISKWLR